jgi:hypothetical protein
MLLASRRGSRRPAQRVTVLQEMAMHSALSHLSKHFFPAATALTVVTLLLGNGALAILCIVAGLIALPLAYAGEVDDIARAAREGRFRD